MERRTSAWVKIEVNTKESPPREFLKSYWQLKQKNSQQQKPPQKLKNLEVNNTCANNTWVKEEVSKEILKMDLKENEMPYLNYMSAVKQSERKGTVCFP